MNQRRDDLGGATPGDWLAVVRDGRIRGASRRATARAALCAKECRNRSRCSTSTPRVSDVALVTGQLGAKVGNCGVGRRSGPRAPCCCVAARGERCEGNRNLVSFITGAEEPFGRASVGERPRPARRRLGHRNDLRDRPGVSARYAPDQHPMITAAMLVATSWRLRSRNELACTHRRLRRRRRAGSCSPCARRRQASSWR